MNFLSEGIGTTITVNQVESDGYEAKNLLGSDLNLQSSRGFLAESFVRPPVTLSIKFPLCIELSHIVINPKLGKQITSAVVIHTETSYKVRGTIICYLQLAICMDLEVFVKIMLWNFRAGLRSIRVLCRAIWLVKSISIPHLFLMWLCFETHGLFFEDPFRHYQWIAIRVIGIMMSFII